MLNVFLSPARMLRQVFGLVLAVSTLALSACKEDDPVAKTFDVEVTLEAPAGYLGKLDGIEVVVSGTGLTNQQKAMTNASGKAIFKLGAGNYKVTVSKISDKAVINGTLDAAVSGQTSLTVKLNIISIRSGLVFKEIYYSGSKTTEGKNYYSDQFIEIYNNSDSVIYLDGLCFGAMVPNLSSAPSKWADESGKLPNLLPLGMCVSHIPGSGKEHPLQPRTSIIIAQDGIDHKNDPKGNPNSPVNLGKADWELYIGDINGGKDADAAPVPNAVTFYVQTTTILDALYPVDGPAMVMFRLPAGVDPKTYASDAKNLATEPNNANAKLKYLLIPKDYVIDAVECVRGDASKRYKRVPADLDAGYVFCTNVYSSKSIRRKVQLIVDGKVIYQDTNNSSNDFLGDQAPTPKMHPTKAD